MLLLASEVAQIMLESCAERVHSRQQLAASASKQALESCTQVEVEILNYRRDGTAFFNAFLLLPVRMSRKRKAKVRYFVAIQKDVTYLRLDSTAPMAWTPVEVALVFDRYGLGQFGKQIIEAGKG